MLTVSLIDENIGPKESKQLRDWLAEGNGSIGRNADSAEMIKLHI